MAVDPRHLRPADVARLLNSTTLGTVIGERQLHRHRTRAGFRIGDGKSVDLLRYLAWLYDEVHAPVPSRDAVRDYAAHREAMRARMAEIMGVDSGLVSIKATTTEKLGFTGRGEGIAAQAVATLIRT